MVGKAEIPYGIKRQCEMREIFLELAQAYGIGPQIAALMEDRHKTALLDWPLSKLLCESRKISGFSKKRCRTKRRAERDYRFHTGKSE